MVVGLACGRLAVWWCGVVVWCSGVVVCGGVVWSSGRLVIWSGGLAGAAALLLLRTRARRRCCQPSRTTVAQVAPTPGLSYVSHDCQLTPAPPSPPDAVFDLAAALEHIYDSLEGLDNPFAKSGPDCDAATSILDNVWEEHKAGDLTGSAAQSAATVAVRLSKGISVS